MTEKKALELLKDHEYWTMYSWQDEVCEIAIKALEKQIPKKPHKNYKKVNLKWCECGNYLGELKNEQNYCKRCGQALDWG